MAVVICPPNLDWNFMTQRPHQLMKQFAKNGYPVYYCNENSTPQPPHEVEPNLFVIHDKDKFLEEIRPGIKDKVILWVNRAATVYELDRWGADLVVYDCCDHFEEWLPAEKQMIRRADMVFASSEWLYRRMLREHPFVVKVLNACDFEHFNSAVEKQLVPGELSGARGPVIGYMGAVASWVDADRINRLARLRPEYTVALVGALIGGERGLGRYPNLHLLGEKPYEELPNYLSCFDAALIPFKINYTTLAASPVKLFEYLAAGKPVITTPLPEVMYVDPTVSISFTRADMPKVVDSALYRRDSRLREERIGIAARNTWEQRFRDIEEALEKALAMKKNHKTKARS